MPVSQYRRNMHAHIYIRADLQHALCVCVGLRASAHACIRAFNHGCFVHASNTGNATQHVKVVKLVLHFLDNV
eukprot:1038642-Lingulodinium_polyedra.AAC.1